MAGNAPWTSDELGLKTGKGFYAHITEEADKVSSSANEAVMEAVKGKQVANA